MFRWATVALFVVCAYLTFQRCVLERPLQRGPGVVAPEAPVQTDLDPDTEAPTFRKGDFDIVALAAFELEARVLAVEGYCCWGADDLVPVDVAFGWGRMSDEAVLQHIDISQRRRFYFWSYEGSPPIPRREIETSSANMHLIPADAAIERRLGRLRSGHVVQLRGYLVEARRADGFVWKSSLSRADTGGGACELVWVEELQAN